MPLIVKGIDEACTVSDVNLLAENEGLSGFRDVLGFSLTEWKEGQVVIEAPVSGRHMNRNGFVHGGVVSSLLDSAAGLAGTFCPVPGHIRRCSTISLNTQFMAPVQSGVMIATARQLSRGRKIFFVEASVTCNGILVATAQGSFRYIFGGEHEQGVPVQ
ncbi:PaaI family thioesterase [Marinobacter daepoensis]|uniref:PaaI family thioesterase n=1 Tax=Marinobacter daepoensis TaxID=262077 RepID=UPI00040675D2|nr:PaaI family thioesterase [Marinobacter daepoensis]